jgi:hypothetical protein
LGLHWCLAIGAWGFPGIWVLVFGDFPVSET